MRSERVNRYYTAAKTMRIICGILLTLAVIILYRQMGMEHLAYSIVFIVCNAHILGVVLYYLLYGVKKKIGVDRLIVTWIMLLLLFVIFFLGGGLVILQVLSGVYLMLIAYLILTMVFKKTNGDYKVEEREKFTYLDVLYFTYINDKLSGLKASFPLDMENYRFDRKDGRIIYIGRIFGGKLIGRYGALVKSGKHLYLCPLDEITIKGGIEEVIAEYKDEVVVKAVYDSVGREESRVTVIGREGIML
jgi:hypothetical protein